MSLKGVWLNKGGYLGSYGEANWYNEATKVVDKTWCGIFKLIDHVIIELVNIYSGTPYENSFLIFHDWLSAWWEAEAQQYISSKGFGKR